MGMLKGLSSTGAGSRWGSAAGPQQDTRPQEPVSQSWGEQQPALIPHLQATLGLGPPPIRKRIWNPVAPKKAMAGCTASGLLEPHPSFTPHRPRGWDGGHRVWVQGAHPHFCSMDTLGPASCVAVPSPGQQGVQRGLGWWPRETLTCIFTAITTERSSFSSSWKTTNFFRVRLHNLQGHRPRSAVEPPPTALGAMAATVDWPSRLPGALDLAQTGWGLPWCLPALSTP